MTASETITVAIDADDPISAAGTAEALRGHPVLHLFTGPENGTTASVTVVIAESIDDTTLGRIRAARREVEHPVVVVATSLDAESVLAAAQAGARSIVWRREASAELLAQAVTRAAHGLGSVPADVLGNVLDHVCRIRDDVLTPRGLRLNGLSDREVAVLRLVADGLETREVAERLNYSERTIKGILHDITNRLQLRNRTHAVAYAVREGLI